MRLAAVLSLLLVMIVMAAGLSSCNQPSATIDPYTSTAIRVYTDPGTSCQYLMHPVSNGYTMTPRLDQRGHVICDIPSTSKE